MKSPKRWYWLGLLAVVLALATAASRVKGDSPRGLEKFHADGTATVSTDGTSSTGTIKGDEIGTAAITDTGYAGSTLGATGNSPDFCFLGGGVATITIKDGSMLTLARQGTLCTLSGDGVTSGVTGNQIYLITGGTGRFAGATGGGNYTFSINNGSVSFHIDGNIQAPADRDHD